MNTMGDVISKRTGTTFAPDLGFEPPEWTLAAVCQSVDPEIFFPNKGESPNAAKRVCDRCPVIVECLAFATAHGERYGVYGGKSERERRALARSGQPSTTSNPGSDGREKCSDCGRRYLKLRTHRTLAHSVRRGAVA